MTRARAYIQRKRARASEPRRARLPLQARKAPSRRAASRKAAQDARKRSFFAFSARRARLYHYKRRNAQSGRRRRDRARRRFTTTRAAAGGQSRPSRDGRKLQARKPRKLRADRAAQTIPKPPRRYTTTSRDGDRAADHHAETIASRDGRADRAAETGRRRRRSRAEETETKNAEPRRSRI